MWTALGGRLATGVELAHNVRSPHKVAGVLREAERAGGTIRRTAAAMNWGGTPGAFADPTATTGRSPATRLDDQGDGTVRI